MNSYKELADLMFPNITKTVEEIENQFPEREGEKGKFVTRFAPSPTGYMHIGGLYVSLINKGVAKQHNGTFYLRIEDTDQSRKLDNGVTEIINTLKNYDISFDEGPIDEINDRGNYGSYRQSERKDIYQTYAKFMVENNLAYPCFCSKEELDEIRETQTKEKSSMLGYGGKYAKCRFLTPEQAIEKIKNGEKFVVRYRSPITDFQRVTVEDIVRGKIEMEDNNIDIVIIKSDGLPTYHFAHVIDDHLMHTTHVIRADEWIASLPLHVQMFKILNFKVPKYAHVCPILKMDGTSKRKLSKRKDPEARVGFYFEQGYPTVAVNEYLLNLINSRFEMWRKQNPNVSYKDFEVKLSEMNASGALFDFLKLENISKKIIKSMSNEEVFNSVLFWAQQNSKSLENIIEYNSEKFKNSIAIWHENRMDIAKWSEIEPKFDYLYNQNFNLHLTDETQPYFNMKFVKEILSDYVLLNLENADSSAWFESVKSIAEKYNYATNTKEYKLNPENYNGSIIDVTTFIRIALTGKKDSPDILQISKFIGLDEAKNRIQKAISLL